MAGKGRALCSCLALALTCELDLGAAHAEEASLDPPIVALEARVGYGMAFGGGAGATVERWSPVTITALVDHALVVDPWTSVFAGVAVEGHGRGAAGAIVGARVRPAGTHLRLAGGAAAMLFPNTVFGPLASIGRCLALTRPLSVCLDIEGVVFVAGSDLPDERIAGQAQLVLGVAFDAL